MDDFDIVVEQQDQELAMEGNVSPYTQYCLEEMVAGKPMPRLSAEALQRVTASWHRSMAQNAEDEDLYIDLDDE